MADPFQQQYHETITAFLLSQLDHAPTIISAKKKILKQISQKSKLIRNCMLGTSVTNLSHTRNFITCPVCAARIRHRVSMVSVSVHFKNLDRIINKIEKSIKSNRINFDNLIKTTQMTAMLKYKLLVN